MTLNIYKLLQPAPFLPQSQDIPHIESAYKEWRTRIVYSMCIGYAFYYMTRKSFTAAMPFIGADLGFSKAELGILGTIFYLVYGVSKFLGGVISDRSNPRYFMAFGLIAAGVLNFLFGLTSDIWVMAVIWGINGVFQAWGWPACTKLLTYWFSKKERGFWWGLCASSHNIGGAIIPVLGAFLASYFSWRVALLFPGIISILIGLFLINRLRDVPETLGLPNADKLEEMKGLKKQKNTSKLVESEEELMSVKDILLTQVLNNPFIWLLGFCYFFVYVTRISMTDWIMFYLIEAKSVLPTVASSSVTWFEMAGLVGMISSGWMSDKIFHGNRIPFIIVASILAMIFLWLLSSNLFNFILFDFILVAGVGYCIFSCHMLIGVAGAEFVHKNAAASAHGFTSLFGYIGAAASAYPMGIVLDNYGWSNFFYLLIFVVFCNLFLSFFLTIFNTAKPVKMV